MVLNQVDNTLKIRKKEPMYAKHRDILNLLKARSIASYQRKNSLVITSATYYSSAVCTTSQESNHQALRRK